jgi:aspartate 1-decarboxylase
VQVGDRVIIISYCWIEETEALEIEPKVVFVDDNNRIMEESAKEVHGDIK